MSDTPPSLIESPTTSFTNRARPLAMDVAHELSNVLGCLTILPDVMMRHIPPDSPLRRDLMEMRRAVQRLDDLATHLSLLSSDRTHLGPLNLGDLVRVTLAKDPLRLILQDCPSVLTDFRFEDGLPPIQGSADWIPVILRNLVRNALDAMAGGGRLSVSAAFRRLSADHAGLDRVPGGDYAVLSVGDSGPLLTPEQRASLFEPYFSQMVLARPSGGGLALMVVRRLVRRQGGFVDVRSDPAGSFFDVYFPVIRDAVIRPESPASVKRPRLLIVDDRRDQRELFGRLLENAGHEVVTVASESEALEALARQAADIVLLDISLRKQHDGFDLYRTLRARWPGQKVIFVSGHGREEYAETLPDLMEAPFLKKPFSAKTLLATVQDLLASAGPR